MVHNYLWADIFHNTYCKKFDQSSRLPQKEPKKHPALPHDGISNLH